MSYKVEVSNDDIKIIGKSVMQPNDQLGVRIVIVRKDRELCNATLDVFESHGLLNVLTDVRKYTWNGIE